MQHTFNRTLTALTATGAIPVFACLLINAYPNLALQQLIVTYIAVVLAFIAGIDWLLGIQLKSLKIVLWAVLCSLLPVMMIALHLLMMSLFSALVTLSLLLAQLWLMLLADHSIYKRAEITHALRFRKAGSFCLTVAILTNIALAALN